MPLWVSHRAYGDQCPSRRRMILIVVGRFPNLFGVNVVHYSRRALGDVMSRDVAPYFEQMPNRRTIS